MEQEIQKVEEVKSGPRWFGIFVSALYLIATGYAFFWTSLFVAVGLIVRDSPAPPLSHFTWFMTYTPTIVFFTFFIAGLFASLSKETSFKRNFIRFIFWVPIVLFIVYWLLSKFFYW